LDFVRLLVSERRRARHDGIRVKRFHDHFPLPSYIEASQDGDGRLIPKPPARLSHWRHR